MIKNNTNILIGRALIKSLLPDIPHLPGVYKMFGESSEIIYIGKAKNLNKRLSSYTKNDLIGKVAVMVPSIYSLEYIISPSEIDALIMEAQLIKKNQPKFNILLKDDKYFPYIQLRSNHEYPQLVKYRGKSLIDGEFFGPFISSHYVDSTLSELQKIFKLRSCSDNYLKTRKRPCLQYQIKRCFAPCVGKISNADYNELVSQVRSFLLGHNQELQKKLAQKMEEFSEEMQFEAAAELRDRIKALSYIQMKSGIVSNSIKNADVIAINTQVDSGIGQYCIQVFLYRFGQFCGNKAYFPSSLENETREDVLIAFMEQFYQNLPPPDEIIVNCKIQDIKVLSAAMLKLYNKSVSIIYPHTGEKKQLILNAEVNALEALEMHLKNATKRIESLKAVQALFNLPRIPKRIEVYDNSHIMGAFPVGAMIVATDQGFDKKEYRLFSIQDCDNSFSKGDDYAMLRQVLSRRLSRLLQESTKIPDLMIIDGGKGHMSVVKDVMSKLKIYIPFVCMSKGEDRNAGHEHFYQLNHDVFTLDKNTDLMKYLQILRDEAHNFVINSHRNKRSKAIKASTLDDIPGIGAARKKALLYHFGSFKAIYDASIVELAKTPGCSKKIAEIIFNSLHSS